MQYNLTKIAIIILKKMAHSHSGREQEQLDAIFSREEQNRFAERLSGNSLNNYFETAKRFDVEEGITTFRQRITKRNIPSLALFRWIGAAIVLLLIGLTSLFYVIDFNGSLPEGNRVFAIEADSLEKSSKQQAVVRLADGSEIQIGGDSLRVKIDKKMVIGFKNGTIDYTLTEKPTTLEFNQLEVPRGGECFIRLDDGTKVWVNAESKLRYPVHFLGDERHVKIQGEAYFEVTPDHRPFIVETELGQIQVLGTVFAVKAYPESKEVLTTLVKGSVRFSGTQSVKLQPGEQAVASTSGMILKRQVRIDEYIGWKESIYVFRQKRLEEIMVDLARWYNVSIFYEQQELRDITFSGSVKRYVTIDVFLRALGRTQDISYRKNGDTILFYRD